MVKGMCAPCVFEYTKVSQGTVEKLPTLEDIIEVCCTLTGVYIYQLKGRSRKQNICVARFIAFTLIKRHLKLMTLQKIGKFFNRDHTTIIYGLRTANDLAFTDWSFRNKLDVANKMVLKRYSNDQTETN